jgi:hypothetical protein
MTINGTLLKDMFLMGAALLEKNKRSSTRLMFFRSPTAIPEQTCP